MFKRKIVLAMAVLFAAGILGGCNGEKTTKTDADTVSEATTTEKEATEENASTTEEATTGDEEKTAEAADGYMSIGDEAKGYIEIPEDWLDFFDSSTNGMNAEQYCSPDMGAIITLMVYDEMMVENGLITADQLSAFDAYTLANNAYYILEEQGFQDLTAATVTLDGRSCYQVYGGLSTTIMITWYFEDAEGYVHYICVEAPYDKVMDVHGYIENSYHLDEAK